MQKKDNVARSNETGITLIEAIVYVAIVAVLFVSAVQAVLAATDVFSRSRVKRALAAEAQTIMERMLFEIRLAHGIDSKESAFGVHPGILVLETRVSASDDTKTTKTFSVSEGAVQIAEGAAPAVVLSGSVSVTSLVFRFINTSPPAVRVEMTVENSYKDIFESRNFYGTAVLRGGY